MPLQNKASIGMGYPWLYSWLRACKEGCECAHNQVSGVVIDTPEQKHEITGISSLAQWHKPQAQSDHG